MGNITNGFVLRPVPQLLFPLVKNSGNNWLECYAHSTSNPVIRARRNSWEQLGTAGNNSMALEVGK